MGTCFAVVGLANAKAGVNKPELFFKEFTNVIDVAGFFSSGQVNSHLKSCTMSCLSVCLMIHSHFANLASARNRAVLKPTQQCKDEMVFSILALPDSSLVPNFLFNMSY